MLHDFSSVLSPVFLLSFGQENPRAADCPQAKGRHYRRHPEPDQSGVRQGQYILQELEKRHIQPAEILESSNIRAAAALAANGYGIGFLSGELLEHLELNISFGAYPLQNCALHIESVAAWRTGDYLPRYAQAFIKLMEQV